MLVVEFRLDSPILRTALSQAPNTTVTREAQYHYDDEIVFLFWAAGDDVSAFEDGLTADLTVSNPVLVAETETCRLYRVTFTEYGANVATFPSWSDLNISVLSLQGSHEGWEIRMRMPDRNTLQRYREQCQEQDLGFQLESIYEETDAASEAEAQLTQGQQEALATAHEFGYFEIPRQASLADIAAECGVSQQAVSERLRRGIQTLVGTALSGEDI